MTVISSARTPSRPGNADAPSRSDISAPLRPGAPRPSPANRCRRAISGRRRASIRTGGSLAASHRAAVRSRRAAATWPAMSYGKRSVTMTNLATRSLRNATKQRLARKKVVARRCAYAAYDPPPLVRRAARHCHAGRSLPRDLRGAIKIPARCRVRGSRDIATAADLHSAVVARHYAAASFSFFSARAFTRTLAGFAGNQRSSPVNGSLPKRFFFAGTTCAVIFSRPGSVNSPAPFL